MVDSKITTSCSFQVPSSHSDFPSLSLGLYEESNSALILLNARWMVKNEVQSGEFRKQRTLDPYSEAWDFSHVSLVQSNPFWSLSTWSFYLSLSNCSNRWIAVMQFCNNRCLESSDVSADTAKILGLGIARTMYWARFSWLKVTCRSHLYCIKLSNHTSSFVSHHS